MIGDLNIKLRHHAGLDVLKHHVSKQVCPIIDVAGSGQLGAVVLRLDGPGANHPHVV